jgi:hypothetical protein
MKNKIIYIIIIISIILFFLSGCTDTPTENNKDIYSRFAGTWKQDDFNGQEWVFTFNQNGTYDTNKTVPGEYVILNETHLDLIIRNNSATYAYEFLNNDQTLTLSLYGWGNLDVTYILQKIE